MHAQQLFVIITWPCSSAEAENWSPRLSSGSHYPLSRRLTEPRWQLHSPRCQGQALPWHYAHPAAQPCFVAVPQCCLKRLQPRPDSTWMRAQLLSCINTQGLSHSFSSGLETQLSADDPQPQPQGDLVCFVHVTVLPVKASMRAFEMSPWTNCNPSPSSIQGKAQEASHIPLLHARWLRLFCSVSQCSELFSRMKILPPAP